MNEPFRGMMLGDLSAAGLRGVYRDSRENRAESSEFVRTAFGTVHFPQGTRRRGGSVIPASDVLVVKLKQAGGTQGTATVPATWAYNFYRESDTAFANPLSTGAQQPLAPRPDAGQVSQAADNSVGLAVKLGGEWRLAFAFGERLLTKECNGA